MRARADGSFKHVWMDRLSAAAGCSRWLCAEVAEGARRVADLGGLILKQSVCVRTLQPSQVMQR